MINQGYQRFWHFQWYTLFSWTCYRIVLNCNRKNSNTKKTRLFMHNQAAPQSVRLDKPNIKENAHCWVKHLEAAVLETATVMCKYVLQGLARSCLLIITQNSCCRTVPRAAWDPVASIECYFLMPAGNHIIGEYRSRQQSVCQQA